MKLSTVIKKVIAHLVWGAAIGGGAFIVYDGWETLQWWSLLGAVTVVALAVFSYPLIKNI